MSVIKPARAIALPVLSVSFPDLRRWVLRVSVFALCLFAALFLTAVRLEITHSRYDLSDLHRQRESLAAEVSRLQVETASLASPRRIEELARKMGFVYPDRNSVVVLDE